MSARVRIEESGLLFREFDDSDVFEIEKSVLYRALHEGGVKTVEFWLIYDENKLLLVEAKSSSPNPENSEGFELYIAETAEKFVHSISLFASAFMKVLPDAGQEMPEKFRNFNCLEMSFRFILIINGHKEEWLAPVGDALKRKLKPYLKIWRIGENGVAVLNQDGARMRGLVV